MIIKTLFLAGFILASALAAGGEGNRPFPAALLVESNFDFSLIPKEFRVHYGGQRAGLTTPSTVSIKIYNPNGQEAFTYNLDQDEKNKKKAFHFAIDNMAAGAYQVAVCADGECSEKTPSLTDFSTTTDKHTISCKQKDSSNLIEVTFVEPSNDDWAELTYYSTFSAKINKARREASAPGDDYETDYEKHQMNANPYYKQTEKIFHTAITHDLKNYRDFFDKTKVDDYCGRKNMLSLHSHIVDTATKKVIHRFKTVNHLSKGGEALFIHGDGGRILLESTHKNVDLATGKTYEVWVSLCVTDKDTVESTYCSSPIKRDLTVN